MCNIHLSLLLEKQYKPSEHMDFVKSQAASQARARYVTTNFSSIESPQLALTSEI